MDCITTTRFSIVLNGVAKGNIFPSRGLHQGCPLSPYLFLLCAEGFSALLANAETEGSLMGFFCTRRSPRLSHLIFADDSSVFCRTILRDGESILSLLHRYEQASGQTINMEKSIISFSPNVPQVDREILGQLFRIRQTQLHSVYLGLSSLIRAN